MKLRLVKRENGSEYLLLLMQWALLSLLLTRLYINLTRAQISFGEWHIAHVLWGGVFMLSGIIVTLAFEGRRARETAAILAGIGWGLFIDEIGKYLTKSNDYWFQPAIIFIYISFILIFLVYRYVERLTHQDSRSRLYSVMTHLEEAADSDLNKSELRAMVQQLNLVIKEETEKEKLDFAKGLLGVVQKLKAKEDAKGRGLRVWIGETWTFSYNRLLRRRMVKIGLLIYSIYYSADKIGLPVCRATDPSGQPQPSLFC